MGLQTQQYITGIHFLLCEFTSPFPSGLCRSRPDRAKMVSVVGAVFVALSLAPLLVLSVLPIGTQPEQVHISYAGRSLICFHSSLI